MYWNSAVAQCSIRFVEWFFFVGSMRANFRPNEVLNKKCVCDEMSMSCGIQRAHRHTKGHTQTCRPNANTRMCRTTKWMNEWDFDIHIHTNTNDEGIERDESKQSGRQRKEQARKNERRKKDRTDEQIDRADSKKNKRNRVNIFGYSSLVFSQQFFRFIFILLCGVHNNLNREKFIVISVVHWFKHFVYVISTVSFMCVMCHCNLRINTFLHSFSLRLSSQVFFASRKMNAFCKLKFALFDW